MACDYAPHNELRLVLIGITGSGKSASANTILGEKRFHSEASASSVTETCKVGHKTRFGHSIVIVDTPGAFDTKRSQGKITKEIIKCITMSAPGPHAFIMVLQAKRFTPEEQKTIEYFEDVFGKALFDYLFLLFTHVDDLEEDGKTLEGFLSTAPENLKKIISACGRRYFGFNNREKDEEKKENMVFQLVDMIQKNVAKKNHQYYKSELLEIAEKEVQKREKEILKKKEKEIQEERQKIEREYKAKMEKNRKESEERVQKMLKEKENEMKKREEEILKGEKLQEEYLRKMQDMEKKQRMSEMETQRMLDEIFKANEEERRRQARNEVRREAETNEIIVDAVANALKRKHYK